MGFEMGFKKTFDESYDEKDVYWFWCGWDYVKLYNGFIYTCAQGVAIDDNNSIYRIPVKSLAFINTLYNKVSKNEFYTTYTKLLVVDDCLAEEYLDKSNLQIRIALALDFVLPQEYVKYQSVASFLYEKTIDGDTIVESLSKAYDKMIADNIEYVCLYGG